MKASRIGQLEVSVVGLGCNNFGRALDEERSAAVVRSALDSGINYFDTARNYGDGQSESFLSKALGPHRSDVVIATKFGRIPRLPENRGGRRDDIRRSIEMSLSELRTDHIDLYQLHFPDPDIPIGETLAVLEELVEEGKVREIGCANFDAPLLVEALETSGAYGRPAFVSNQVHYSMVHREPEVNGLADLCRERGIALLPYYPLASGLLTGKVGRGETPRGRLQMERYSRFLIDENFDVVEAVRDFARDRDLTVAQVALTWLLTRPAVPSVTPGATRPEQVTANVAATEWEPSRSDIVELDSLLGPSPGVT